MATDSSDQLNFNPTTTTEENPKQTIDDDTTTSAVTPPDRLEEEEEEEEELTDEASDQPSVTTVDFDAKYTRTRERERRIYDQSCAGS